MRRNEVAIKTPRLTWVLKGLHNWGHQQPGNDVNLATTEGKQTMQTLSLKNVKPGDYIKRKADAKGTYIKGSYDRATKSFSCIDVEDICREVFIKADKAVFVGFTYWK